MSTINIFSPNSYNWKSPHKIMSSRKKNDDENKHRWYSIHSEESLPTAPDGDEYYVYPYDDNGDDNCEPSERFNSFCNARNIGTFARVFSFFT